MKLTSVIRRPLVTEKTSNARASAGILVFEVAPEATKIEVKKPCRPCSARRCFGEDPNHARQVQAPGPVRGQRSDWKKAWVKLKAGEKVPEFMEGA